jgi:mannosyltransferase OCH1-like enzyme
MTLQPAQLQHLLERDFSNIGMPEYPALFSHVREHYPCVLSSNDGNKSTPHVLFQYWDDAPDADVMRLLAETEQKCETDDVEWQLFDNESAIAYLENYYGNRHVEAYQKCVHPAQCSDFFRYCFLLQHGGMWLDADLYLLQSPKPFLELGKPVFVQRDQFHGQLTNWMMIAPAGNPLIEQMIDLTLRNIEDDTLFKRCTTHRDIVSVSGPRIVRKVVARCIHEHLRKSTATPPPMTIIDERLHDQFIAYAQVLLGRPPLYKKDSRSWQRWQSELGSRNLVTRIRQLFRL